MNLQELRDVQDRERATDSIQELPDDFYEEVSAYIRERKADRAAAAEGAEDPFSVPEVSRLTDEIETAEQVATAIYERRMGKLLTQASLAAADVGPSVDGLTAEEQDLFDDLVERIESNKDRVLSVLTDSGPPDALSVDGPAGEVDSADPTDRPPGQSTVGPAGAADDGSVDAAELMGSADDAGDGSGPATDDGDREPANRDPDDPGGTDRTDHSPPDGPAPDGHPPEEPPDRSPSAAPADGAPATDEGTGGAPEDPGLAPGDPGVEPGDSDGAPGAFAGAPGDSGADGDRGGRAGADRVTVQVTRDVGEVFGVDERVYDLAADDVVTLPAENATALVDRGAAEQLDGPDADDGDRGDGGETDAARTDDSPAG